MHGTSNPAGFHASIGLIAFDPLLDPAPASSRALSLWQYVWRLPLVVTCLQVSATASVAPGIHATATGDCPAAAFLPRSLLIFLSPAAGNRSRRGDKEIKALSPCTIQKLEGGSRKPSYMQKASSSFCILPSYRLLPAKPVHVYALDEVLQARTQISPNRTHQQGYHPVQPSCMLDATQRR